MSIADRYDCFLLDLDGVLVRGSQAVTGAPESVRELRRRRKRPVFMTNNSSKTPAQVAAALAAVGVEASDDEVVTSADATAEVLAGGERGRAFVVGERGIREALADVGFELVDGEPDQADVVVVGWDRTADYAKLRRASLLVERGARLVATNPDRSYPAEDGQWPGAGALLSVITVTTGATAEVIGKPNAPVFRAAHERAGGGRPLVVGDRLDTDVAGAASLGWDSLLVLSGISSRADVDASNVRPTYVAEDISSLVRDDVEAAGPEAPG
jgi:glycerol-1-phosphatase